ncbi:MAG: flagellar hook capping FlgD N-terminal domain-containing protein [Clostridia bacterium]|jgi:flagellar basal-body rod modification protein FlgD
MEIMSVVGGASAGQNQARSPAKELGKDEFLRILVTQLQNQDPLNPNQDAESIAQMAQFSALEQMKALNNSMFLVQAYSLIGKTVSAKWDGNGIERGGLIQGRVERVSNSREGVSLYIQGRAVRLEDVLEVYDGTVVSEEAMDTDL